MEQMNLFEVLYEKYRIKNRIRLIELFGGIGSQAKALEMLQEQGKLPNGFEHYRLVEFDKYPIASYNAVHGTNFEPTDITKIQASDLGIVDRDKYEYILTYSFPCQDLSLAGKGRGMKKGSGTRSGLLWEVERLLNECGEELPQILLMENVPNLLGDKNIEDFKAWVRFLEGKGYSCYYELLNAKEIGYPNPIPQNRQRCFMISILGDAYYQFPKSVPLKLKLEDMLQPEEEIDEKYYLSDKLLECISFNEDIDLSSIKNKNAKEKFILVKEATKKGFALASKGDSISLERPESQTRRGRVGKGIAQTLLTSCEQGVVVDLNKESPKCIGGFGEIYNDGYQYAMQKRIYDNKIATSITTAFNPFYKFGLRIRKLTPKEAWRLMGFSDQDFDKASKVNSNAQLYKQAGNSIVVNVLMAIFNQLL